MTEHCRISIVRYCLLISAERGVMIPQTYTAYITPIMSHKVYSAVQNMKEQRSWETPFVVLLDAIAQLSAIIQPVWTFSHPNFKVSTSNIHNTREATNTFVVTSGICHGLAGYFESVLYKDIELSTRPDQMALKSPDMASWFPIFFPLKVGQV